MNHADHINDYHGAVAPLHLLPKIVPCLLSLHNAEFQGLWYVTHETPGPHPVHVVETAP